MTDLSHDTRSIDYKRAIGRFTAYRFVSRFSFYVPVLVVALILIGLSYLEIGLLLAIYGLSTTFAGGIARRTLMTFGARRTLILGEAMKGLSGVLLFVVIGHHVPAIPSGIGGTLNVPLFILILAQFIGGIGYSFAATSDGTFLASLSALADSDDTHRKAEARSSSLMFISFLTAGVIGGVVALYDPSLPFAMTVFAQAGAIFVLLGLHAPVPVNRQENASKTPEIQKPTPSPISYSRPALLAPMAFYASFRALVLAVQIVLMPIVLFVDHHLSIAAFGVVFASYTLSGFFAGRYYNALLVRFGEHGLLLLMIVAQTISLAALAAAPFWLAIVAPLPVFFVAGMLRPYCLPKINAAVDDPTQRPHVISMAERIMGLLNAIIVAGSGAILAVGVKIWVIFLLLAGLSVGIGTGVLILSARMERLRNVCPDET